MSGRTRFFILFTWFVLYRMLCGYLLFPLAKIHFTAAAFYSFRLAVSLLLLGVAVFAAGRFLFEEYSRITLNNLGYVITALIVLMLIQYGFRKVSGMISTGGWGEQTFSAVYLRSDPFGYFLSSVLILPLYEELVFRVSLYGFLSENMPGVFAAVSANLLFAFSHVALALFSGNMISMLLLTMYFLCGIVLQYLYKRTDCLTAAATHSLFNLLALIW